MGDGRLKIYFTIIFQNKLNYRTEKFKDKENLETRDSCPIFIYDYFQGRTKL